MIMPDAVSKFCFRKIQELLQNPNTKQAVSSSYQWQSSDQVELCIKICKGYNTEKMFATNVDVNLALFADQFHTSGTGDCKVPNYYSTGQLVANPKSQRSTNQM